MEPDLPLPIQALNGPEALVSPGDRIELRVFLEEDMSDEYPVDEEGYVVLPKLGRVEVSDVTVRALPEFLRERYTEYLRNPSVEVTVYRRIGVHGEVNEPTLYWLDITMTLRDAIAMAGGVTEEGNPDRVLLIRGDQRLEFEGYGRSALLAVGLRSGDQIIVDRRSWISLNAPFLISASVSVFSILAGFMLAR
ncbi:polysaccharide biosynthesis/export family protein [Gemmatimonadota bacterium]